MKRWLLIAIAALATAGFIALGAWQVERRAWKLALIDRVEQRIHAAPVAAPGPQEWPRLTRESAEYRRVTVTGHFMEDRQTLVRAVTDLGAGFWLMTPLRTDEGFVVLVNRGFVLKDGQTGIADAAAAADTAGAAATANSAKTARIAGTADTGRTADAGGTASTSGTHDTAHAAADSAVSVTGLLRISEPGGAFLRSNAPTDNRWYSRDVEAISHARRLTNSAPYFIDAEASATSGPDSSRPPVAGLTVVHFRNSHLQYAITWFILASMALVLGVRVARTR